MDNWKQEQEKARQDRTRGMVGAAEEQRNYGDTCAQAVGTGVREMSYGEVVLMDLRDRARRSEIEADRTKRAVDILERHPEFLEFIELVRSGVVRLN